VPIAAGHYSGRLADYGGGLALARGSLCFAMAYSLTGTADVEPLRRRANGSFSPVGALQDSGLALRTMGVLDAAGKRLCMASADKLRVFRVNPSDGALTQASDYALTPGAYVEGMVIVPK